MGIAENTAAGASAGSAAGPYGAIIGAAGSIIGGFLGSDASDEQIAAAQHALDQARATIMAIGAPPDMSGPIILNAFKQAGLYSPALEQAINAGISQASQVSEDPTLRTAQVQALSDMSERSKTGLLPEDIAKLNQIRMQNQSDIQGKQGQILQDMASRGMAGGGAELAAKLASSQQGAQNEATQGLQVGAQASQNAMQAMLNAGNLAGGIRSQDFSNAMTKANAADQFKRFDVQNQIARQQRNVGTGNQAQQQNLATAQNVSNSNVTQNNAELQREVEAKRQVWLDKLAQAKAASGMDSAIANLHQSQAANEAQRGASMGAGFGALAGAGVNALIQQPAAKYNTSTGERLNNYDPQTGKVLD